MPWAAGQRSPGWCRNSGFQGAAKPPSTGADVWSIFTDGRPYSGQNNTVEAGKAGVRSLNGAFLEAPAEDLPFTDTPVELSLTLSQNGEPRYHRILARVRRVAGNGAGLSFSDLEKDTYFDLVNLVYHA